MVGPHSVRFHYSLLSTVANNCLAIHGDKQQNERDWVLNEFKTGKSPIMVATDVASRGIGMIQQHLLPLPTPSSHPVCFPLQLLPLPSCDMVRSLRSLCIFA
jgi:Helicase conserved C-terminal domain